MTQLARAAYKDTHSRLVVQLRGILISQLLEKSMTTPHSELEETPALALMSTDVDDAVHGTFRILETFAGLLDALLAIAILGSLIGAAALIGVVSGIGRCLLFDFLLNGSVYFRFHTT
jgi:hypothetical protein